MADSVPPPLPASQPAPVPAKSGGNRTLLIILAVIGGMVLLMGGCAIACTVILGKKAKDFAETSQSNPAYAALGLMAAIHPDLEVVSKDADSGVMVIKHKKTGEVSTIDTTQYDEKSIAQLFESLAAGKGVPTRKSPPKVTFTPAAASEDEPPENWPAYVTPYGGATGVKFSTTTNDGMLDFGFSYAATTDDTPEAVLEYYQQALTADGFTVRRNAAGKNTFGSKGSLIALRQEPYTEVQVQAETTVDHRTNLRVTGGEKNK